MKDLRLCGAKECLDPVPGDSKFRTFEWGKPMRQAQVLDGLAEVSALQNHEPSDHVFKVRV